jgi:hypothetical protein
MVPAVKGEKMVWREIDINSVGQMAGNTYRGDGLPFVVYSVNLRSSNPTGLHANG